VEKADRGRIRRIPVLLHLVATLVAMAERFDADEPDVGLGEQVAWRLLAPKYWIHRRVETVRFLDEDTLRRNVSVDCDVQWRGEGPALLPLARIQKQPMTSFDLRDDAGRSLPILTSRENGFVAWSALVAAAAAALEDDVPSSIVASLRTVAFWRPVPGVSIEDQVRDASGDAEARAALFARPAFRGLVESLANGFLLVTPVTDVAEGAQRRVFKYAYSEPLARKRRPTVKQSLGFRPFGVEFDVPLIGDAQGYHVECEVPGDVQISDATLRTIGGEGDMEVTAPGRGDRVHLFASDADAVAFGQASVRILPAPEGMLRATRLSVAVIFASLVAGMVFGGAIERSSDAAAATLLLVPGLLIAIVSKPGEHRLASMVLRGLRWCVAVAAGSSYVAAGAIALSVEGTALRLTFAGLAFVCALCLAAVSVAVRAAQQPSPSAA